MGCFNHNREIGTAYERIAEDWLIGKGFRLIRRGKCLGRGKGNTHFDLIVSKDGVIYDVDVKSCKIHFVLYPPSLLKLVAEAQDKGHVPALIFIYEGKFVGFFAFQF